MKLKSIAAVVFALSTAVASAQPGPQPSGPGGAGPKPPGPAGPQGGPKEGGESVLVAFLQLTEAQKEQWKSLHEGFRAEAQPLLEQQRTLRDGLQELVEQGSSAACSIGDRVLAIDAIGDQLQALRDELENGLKAVLTAEQILRYEAFRAAQAALRSGPGGPPQGGRK